MANISAIKLPSGNTYDLVDKTSGYVTTDEKLVVNQENSNNTYYPIISTSSTAASTKYIDTRGIKLDITNGTERSQGDITLVLGNSTAVNYDGNKAGFLQLYGPYSRYVQIQTPSSFTSDVYLTLPSSTGTLALTSNIKDATLTIQKNGVNVETFSANASSNKTANIVVNEVPSGGTTGQVLAKNSATDYDVSWADASGGGAYIVTFTYDNQNETWSCDKTAQEIYEANEAGYTVIAFAINSYYDGYVFYLDTATTLPLEGGGTQVYTHFRTLARFSKYGSSVYYFELFEIEYADNNITFSECMFDTHSFIQNYETENVTSGLYISSESGAFAEHYNLSSGKSADIYWSSREGEQNDETLIKFTADHIKADNFTPTENDDVSTKKYVDDAVSGVSVPTKTSDLTNDSGFITGMTILSYGSSTWQNFIDAYNANKIVYCRASSNANPASGSQTRLAFMAYVNHATTPTEVEFQYYRSVSTHTASQQGDQVYVYKLNKTNGWSVTVREASVKVVAGTGLSGTYSNGTMTLTGPTKVSDLTNDSGYLTGITSSQVTTALGYTPYNSTNPNGYTSNTGTVTKVTAGTGLSIGTTAGGNFTTNGTINHTNSVTAQTTQAVYPIKIDAQGHISAYGSAVTIPTVNNATLTIQKNGATVNTFTANASSDVTVNITVPTALSGLTNDTGFKKITASTSAPTANDGNDGDVWLVYTTA